MDNPLAHFIEYSSYLLKIYAVLAINDILGCSIIVTGDNNERSNGALNAVNFLFSHHLRILNHTIKP